METTVYNAGLLCYDRLLSSHSIICSSESFSASMDSQNFETHLCSLRRQQRADQHWDTGRLLLLKAWKESLSAEDRVGEGTAFCQGFLVGNESQAGGKAAVRKITEHVSQVFFVGRIGQISAVMMAADSSQICEFLLLLWVSKLVGQI